MNVIEAVKSTLEAYSEISAVCNSIHVDFSSNEPTDYGISSVSDSKLSEDILGNQTRSNTFMLYSTFSSINDYERLKNSSSLLNLGYYLDSQHNISIDNGEIESISVGNGMLYDVPEENDVNGVRYQLQIVATYKIYV